MRKVGDLMAELGFNKNAPAGTQDAFLRHLIKHASATAPTSAPQQVEPCALAAPGEQLFFDPEILGLNAK